MKKIEHVPDMAMNSGITAERINEIIDVVNEMQDHITNLRGGWTDNEIKAVALTKEWPQIGDTIWRFNSQGMVSEASWNNSNKQQNIKAFLGVFKTKKEAEQARDYLLGLGK